MSINETCPVCKAHIGIDYLGGYTWTYTHVGSELKLISSHLWLSDAVKGWLAQLHVAPPEVYPEQVAMQRLLEQLGIA